MSPHKTLIVGLIVMGLLAAGAVIENWRDHHRMTKAERDVANLWLLALAVAFLVFVVMGAVAFPHDLARPELTPWFKRLQSHKGLCCDGSDALHLRDVDWERTKDGQHYRVRIPRRGEDMARAVQGETIETEWVDVPDDAVLEEPNRDGATLVWPLYGAMGTSIRCFMPGSMT
jgi:hypothetical protein